jgi:hypothetical protein
VLLARARLIRALDASKEMLLTLSRLCLMACMSVCVLGAACDGAIHVKGRVYVQTASSGESQAFIDHSLPSNASLSPIKDAKVTLYHAGDYSSANSKNAELRKDSTVTASDGSFEVGGLTSPFRFNAALIVEKDGYKPITKVFYHDKIDHQATIILVPEASKASDRK